MARFLRPSLSLLLLITLVAMGCRPSVTPDEDVHPRNLSEAEDLIQTDDVLLALRIEVDALAETAPLLQRLADTLGDRDLRELAAIAPDPIGHIQQAFDLPSDLPALDRDQAIYILISHLGNDTFFQASLLGLPTRPEEWPQLFNYRILLPSQAPDELREQLIPWLETLQANSTLEAFELYQGPGFLRVEMAMQFDAVHYSDDVDAQAWLSALNLQNLQPPASAQFRPTPAYDAFIGEDAPFGLWTRMESLAALGVLEVFDLFRSDYQIVGPMGRPRFSLEGVARMAGASLIVDPVAAENEDFSLLLATDDLGSLIIDAFSTRTDQGTRIHHTMGDPITLPGFDTTNTFLELSWQLNLDALRASTVSPYWSLMQRDEEWASFDEPEFAEAPFFLPVESAAFVPWLAAGLQYPWTTLAVSADDWGDIFPLPRAMALEAFTISGDNLLIPVGVVAVAVFDDTPETRMTIENFLDLAEGILPVMFDATLIERGDDLIEVRLALNTELEKVFESTPAPSEVATTRFSMDVNPLRNLEGGMMPLPTHDAVDLFDHVHIRDHSERTHSAFRLSLGSPTPQAPPRIDSRVEPMLNPTQRCRTEIAAAAVEHLADLRTDAAGSVETWAAAVEERAARCMEPGHPAVRLIQQRIELAREIAAEIP